MGVSVRVRVTNKCPHHAPLWVGFEHGRVDVEQLFRVHQRVGVRVHVPSRDLRVTVRAMVTVSVRVRVRER